MPSQKTAEYVSCEVKKAIGVEATKETIERLKMRAKAKGINFKQEGLTTMIYPAKKVPSEDGKEMVDGEPVIADLPKDVARKLQKAGAVSVVI